MSHDYLPDPDVPGFCGRCSLPKGNARHTDRAPTRDISEARRDPQPMPPARLHSQTSIDAAMQMWPQAGTWRAKVLDALIAAGLRGLTDDELIRRLGPEQPNSIRPRRVELEVAGWVVPLRGGDGQPVLRSNRSGRQAVVWVAAPHARERAAEVAVSA